MSVHPPNRPPILSNDPDNIIGKRPQPAIQGKICILPILWDSIFLPRGLQGTHVDKTNSRVYCIMTARMESLAGGLEPSIAKGNCTGWACKADLSGTRSFWLVRLAFKALLVCGHSRYCVRRACVLGALGEWQEGAGLVRVIMDSDVLVRVLILPDCYVGVLHGKFENTSRGFPIRGE